MKVLVIGGGGREHAVALALSRSPRLTKLWCAPGNGGTASICENVPIPATDLDGILAFCRINRPDLVAVIPDDPLALGLVDMLEQSGFAAFGPCRAAARLESSKSFSKDFMARHGIPTADCLVISDIHEARDFARRCPLPIVIKADGLALGKGVIICRTREEAEGAVDALSGSAAGSTLLFEEYLEGPEVTQLCFVSSGAIKLMPAAQDHKRAFDGDHGPNTGGMGAFTPVSVYTEEVQKQCLEQILLPTMKGLERDGIDFKGVLYVSLMLTDSGPKVIEYNARFGDPETQAILPLLKTDLLEIMLAVRENRLENCPIEWLNAACCCVVIASGGYPSSYDSGFEITGLDAPLNAAVYHAGTVIKGGKTFTAGGRVLGVTAVGPTLAEAIAAAYADVKKISFHGCFYRTDIGSKDEKSR